MWRSIAIAGKRNSHTLVKGNPQTAFALCGVCCWNRPFASTNGKLEDSKSDGAIDMFSQMVKSRPFPSTVEAFSRVPDYREILRNGLRDLKLDDAIGLFGNMVQSRPRPSIIEFNKLLTEIAKMKKFDVVISLGEQMQNLGISHDLYTYNILINCFCRRSELSPALALLGKMMKLGYEPSIVTLNSLLNGYCLCNRISDAVALFNQMVELGYQPNTVTFNTLIHGVFRNNGASEALSLVEQMVQKGPFQPDLFTYGVVLNGLCKRGDIYSALNLFKEMEGREIEADVVIYNTVIDGLCKYRHVNDAAYNMLIQGADALFRKMKEEGPLPDDATYNMLIRAHLRDGDRAASAELIKEMRSCGFAGDASTIGLVTNMLYDGRLDKSFLDMFS